MQKDKFPKTHIAELDRFRTSAQIKSATRYPPLYPQFTGITQGNCNYSREILKTRCEPFLPLGERQNESYPSLPSLDHPGGMVKSLSPWERRPEWVFIILVVFNLPLA